MFKVAHVNVEYEVLDQLVHATTMSRKNFFKCKRKHGLTPMSEPLASLTSDFW